MRTLPCLLTVLALSLVAAGPRAEARAAEPSDSAPGVSGRSPDDEVAEGPPEKKKAKAPAKKKDDGPTIVDTSAALEKEKIEKEPGQKKKDNFYVLETQSNADQVSKIRGILEALSLEIATPAEARQMLSLKGLAHVGY